MVKSSTNREAKNIKIVSFERFFIRKLSLTVNKSGRKGYIWVLTNKKKI
jgi:hypothetical protein